MDNKVGEVVISTMRLLWREDIAEDGRKLEEQREEETEHNEPRRADEGC